MEQRRLRLGDILDDYCPRERRVTNHAVVAMIEEDVKQTRCTTCDAEHPYKGARLPKRRAKETPGSLYKEVLAGMPEYDADAAAAAIGAPARAVMPPPASDVEPAALIAAGPAPAEGRRPCPARAPTAPVRPASPRARPISRTSRRRAKRMPSTARCTAGSFAPRCRASKGRRKPGRCPSSPCARHRRAATATATPARAISAATGCACGAAASGQGHGQGGANGNRGNGGGGRFHGGGGNRPAGAGRPAGRGGQSGFRNGNSGPNGKRGRGSRG